MKFLFGLGVALVMGMMRIALGAEHGNAPHKEKKRIIHLGLLTDTHGDAETVQYFASRFVEKKADAIILTGDIADKISWISYDRKGETVIRVLARTGLPVYILPGNHDPRYYYEQTIAEIRKEHANLTDLLHQRRINLQGVDLVSNPYGYGKSYWLSGYYATEKEYAELEQLLTHPTKDPVILVTHQPPLCKGKHGVDYTLQGTNDGNKRLDEIMKKYRIRFSFSGHIHSATNGCDESGRFIPQKTFTPALRLNPGAVVKHRTRKGEKKQYAALVIIKEKEIMYELIVRDE